MAMAPRPKTCTPEMALRAAEATVKALVAAGCVPEDETDGMAASIAKYARQHMDGYELAKTLDDRAYWACDFQIAEILDGHGYTMRREIEAAEKAWAAENNIQPPLPVGTKVTIPRGDVGVITEVYQHGAAKYCVSTPEQANNSAWIVNFEDVTAVEAAP